MLLLVSTPLQIFLIDTISGEVSTLRAGDGYYYGISSSKDSIVLTHFGGYLKYYHGEDQLKSVDYLEDPHQVEWVENSLLVANSGRNCVSVFDPQGNFCQDIFLNQIRVDDKKNRSGNHFNSVHKTAERLFVVAHNYEKPSEVYELNWPELQVVKIWPTQATWAHNIWASEIGLVICNTKNGSLYEVTSGETIWLAEDKSALTRGLAVHQDYIFIGRSTLSTRKQRYWTSGGVWIVDRKTLKTIDKIILPGSGEVREIRLVGVPDECHNSTIITPSMVASIKRVSKPVDAAYNFRKTRPSFQQDIPVLSQLIRSRQIIELWKKRVNRYFVAR